MSEIGQFLRARRARLTPEAAGLGAGAGRRRVPGLRREELARLAGVSTDYYVRLEQGRAPRVSDSVLGAIGRALQLSAAEQVHLVRPARPDDVRRVQAEQPGEVGVHVERLLAAMVDLPMYLVGRRTEVVGWNAAAAAVYGFSTDRPRPEVARRLFLDPSARSHYRNWPALAASTVSHLRLELGEFPDDPLLRSLIAELTEQDEYFARLWTTQYLEPRSNGILLLDHPVADELALFHQAVTFPQSPGLTAVINTPRAGTATAGRLRELFRLPPPVERRPRPRSAHRPGTRPPPG